jgi:curved DNA-binding protein CbpA
MTDSFFWRELGLEPGADRKQIKRAYWQLARQNHPDFFPEDRKPIQELKMIALNEAYAYLMGPVRAGGCNGAGGTASRNHAAGNSPDGGHSERGSERSGTKGRNRTGYGGGSKYAFNFENGVDWGLRFDTSWSGTGATGVAEPVNDRTDLGFHKDPSYAYYKQGFVHFSRAIHGIEALYQSLSQRRVVHFKPRDDAYQRFAEGLVELRRAHEYFSRVVQEFDSSIWKHDAGMKLRRIERFSGLYRRILGNLTATA